MHYYRIYLKRKWNFRKLTCNQFAVNTHALHRATYIQNFYLTKVKLPPAKTCNEYLFQQSSIRSLCNSPLKISMCGSKAFSAFRDVFLYNSTPEIWNLFKNFIRQKFYLKSPPSLKNMFFLFKKLNLLCTYSWALIKIPWAAVLEYFS